MGRIIAVVNQKGGVGKTTTAVNITAALAELGKKVLLCDFDPQANATSGLGINKRKLNHSVYDTIINELPTREAIVSTKYGDVLSFSAIEIDPYMNKEPEPQPEYRFATFRGVVKGNELVLEAKMSDDLKSSSRAGKEFRFNGTCNWINRKTP